MRPRSLTIDGIAAFRQRTEIPIGDANLFALVGPTGSGKSTCLDAIVLALYGTIPRLGDQRKIAPALTTGRDSGRIEFTFDVGAATYRVIRQIKRTATGATTKEAVFERIDADSGDTIMTMANSARDFPKAVTATIGLNYDDFTKVVMLPQGNFAAMLNADPGERRKLLIDMLGLGIYERVMQAANQAKTAAEVRIDAISDERQRLAGATIDAVDAAKGKTAALDTLLETLNAKADQRSAAEEIVRERAQTYRETVENLNKVSDIPGCPDDIRQLSTAILDADAAVATADDNLTDARTVVDGLMVDYEQVATAAETARTHQRTRERIASQEQAATQARTEADTEERQAAEVADHAKTAAEELPALLAAATAARRNDAAAHAAEDLHAGDDCPVCQRTLDGDPTVTPNPEMAKVIADAEQAQGDVTRLQSRADTLASTAATADTRATAAEAALAKMIDDAGTLWDDDAISTALAALTTADADLKTARALVVTHEGTAKTAKATRAALDTRIIAARQTLDTIRLNIGDTNCPPVDGPLAEAWDAITAWATGQHAVRTTTCEDAKRLCDDAQEAVDAITRDMQTITAAVDPTLAATPNLQVAVSSAAGTAKATADQLANDLGRATELTKETTSQERRRNIMGTVADLCKTNKIREWLLEDAIQRLVARATVQLQTLSSSRYEMTYTDGDFTICDLFEGAATRPIRSLSGGETFLVSLALALALGEEITANSTATVRTESLFIDEGFGTLDPERLDLVAGVLETLGAERVVGIVTHVPEIAERLPTRIEVTAAPPGGSPTLTRHDS